MTDEPNMYSLEPGCEQHGEEYMRECTMCGAEFCGACAQGAICPECREHALDDDDFDDDDEEIEDFDDDEVEKLLAEADAELGEEDFDDEEEDDDEEEFDEEDFDEEQDEEDEEDY